MAIQVTTLNNGGSTDSSSLAVYTAISQKVTRMFSEPQTVTVSGVAKTLPRVSFGERSGIFQNVTDGILLRITHTLGKRTRNAVRFDFTKTVDDPYNEGINRPVSMSVFLSADVSPVGFTPAEVEANIKAATDWSAVAGNLTKIVNGES